MTCDTVYYATTLLQPSCKEYLDFWLCMVIVVIYFGLIYIRKTCDTVYYATMLLRYYGLVVKNIDFCFF